MSDLEPDIDPLMNWAQTLHDWLYCVEPTWIDYTWLLVYYVIINYVVPESYLTLGF